MTPHDSFLLGTALISAFASATVVVTLTAAAILGTLAVTNFIGGPDTSGSQA